jgi:hypothetical protein
MAHRVISLRCGDLSAFGGIADVAGLAPGSTPVANDPERTSLVRRIDNTRNGMPGFSALEK